jgi:hypothetical protein
MVVDSALQAAGRSRKCAVCPWLEVFHQMVGVREAYAIGGDTWTLMREREEVWRKTDFGQSAAESCP